MLATKEQELKALEKIKKIVEDLGDGSYIGVAFEGCFEIAEENIRNDFACSMKQRAEHAEAEARSMVKRAERAEMDAARYRKQSETCQEDMEQMQGKINRLEEEMNKAQEMDKEQQAKINGPELEILTLKARLYDLICKYEPVA